MAVGVAVVRLQLVRDQGVAPHSAKSALGSRGACWVGSSQWTRVMARQRVYARGLRWMSARRSKSQHGPEGRLRR